MGRPVAEFPNRMSRVVERCDANDTVGRGTSMNGTRDGWTAVLADVADRGCVILAIRWFGLAACDAGTTDVRQTANTKQ